MRRFDPRFDLSLDRDATIVAAGECENKDCPRAAITSVVSLLYESPRYFKFSARNLTVRLQASAASSAR